ncbi:MAG TPA: dihydrolipoamide acetyltransferase family protein [Candidatus Dormibacteraeota bacterium]|nr:dihydrolipoamide acetyltransferase family protein [Candidatus Dormibacteraeota bacterium]
MAVTVAMPQLGESVTEGTITQWLKQPGDPVERYESIAEVTTDKVNAEIPSPVAGVMGEHLAVEGTVVPVGGEICRIEGAAEEAAAAEEARPAEAVGAGTRQEVPAAGGAGATAATPANPAAVASAPAPRGAPAAPDGLHLTPAVRMLAREHAVDLTRLSGSGINGRITKKDVLEYVQRRDSGEAAPPPGGVAARRAEATAQAAAPAPPQAPRPVPAAAPQAAGDTLLPLTPMRRAIAEHMSRSVLTSPHAWTMVEVDMTRVARVRSRQREDFRRHHGADLTFLPFVAKAVVAALRQNPSLNATWTDEGVVLRNEVNLGLAVALEDGLVVPVIRGADRLSMAGLALAAADLTERARNGRLRIEDVEGGTFTLNNAGALGTVMSQAIINQPQAAILVMDAIVKRPVVVDDDAIAVRSMMNLCISFDHRVNDGLAAARFLRSVKDTLESIEDSAALW